MSANEELSPEERLLKVIQQGKTPAAGALTAPAAAAAPARPVQEKPAEAAPKLKLAEPAALKPAPAAVIPAVRPGAQIGVPTPESETAVVAMSAPVSRRLTISAVNRCLFVMVLVALGVLATDFLIGRTGAAVLAGDAGEKEAPPALVQPAKAGEPLAPLEKYLNRRNPFAEISGQTDGGTNVTIKPANTDFRLMAVSFDSKSQAGSMAILAGKEGKQTYYVKCGQTIGDTGVTLKQVSADHVILESTKGEWEIR